MSFVLGWMLCIGLIFIFIVIMSVSKDIYGLIFMVVFVMGLVIFFLLVVLMLERVFLFLKFLKKYNCVIEIVLGLVFILMGILIMINFLESLINFL